MPLALAQAVEKLQKGKVSDAVAIQNQWWLIMLEDTRPTRVPTFEQAIALFQELGLGCNVEIKPCPGREAETARASLDVLDGHWPASAPQPIVSSFSAVSLAAARELYGVVLDEQTLALDNEATAQLRQTMSRQQLAA